MERRNITPVRGAFGLLPNKVVPKETKSLNQTLFTKVFHMVPDQTYKQGAYVILWPSAREVAGEKVESQFIGKETTTRWITKGRDIDEEGDILKLLPDGRLIPSYLPDLSDLALLPIPIKAAMKWYVENSTLCNSAAEKIIWQSPKIAMEREWAWVHEGVNTLEVSSYLDTFKILMIPPAMQIVETRMGWNPCTTNKHDGRKWKVEVRVVWRKNKFSRLKRYIIWNCKGMARGTFVAHITHVVEHHSPDCLMLLETRCSRRMARCISRSTPITTSSSCNAIRGEGGASVMIIASDISVLNKKEEDERCTIWHIGCN